MRSQPEPGTDPTPGRAAQKSATRARIVEAASRLFRRDGIDGVGVDAVMAEAGLTHGGFYNHFPSKEALAAEVCVNELQASAERWAAIAGQPDGLERIVRGYLRVSQDAATGCVLPVLGGELARRPGAREELTASVRAMIATLARVTPARLDGAESTAMAALATMVGAVSLGRLSADPALAEAILESARREILSRPGPAA